MGFSVCAGGPVWERYSGLILFGLEFALFGFFNFNLHSSVALFEARDSMLRKQKKPSSLNQENGWEKDAERQRPF